MNDRHQPNHFEENMKDVCAYCHRTPAIWQQVGGEKVCAHCGTRVYISLSHQADNLLTQAANR